MGHDDGALNYTQQAEMKMSRNFYFAGVALALAGAIALSIVLMTANQTENATANVTAIESQPERNVPGAQTTRSKGPSARPFRPDNNSEVIAKMESDRFEQSPGNDELQSMWNEDVGVGSLERMTELSRMTDNELLALIEAGDLVAPQELAFRLVNRGEGEAALTTLQESVARGSIGSARMLSQLHRMYTSDELESPLPKNVGVYVWHRVAVHMGDYSVAAYMKLDNAERALAELEIQHLISQLQNRQIEIFGELLPYNPHPPMNVDGEGS